MKHDRPSATAVLVGENIALIAATPGLRELVESRAATLTHMLLAAYRPDGGAALRAARMRLKRLLLPLRERFTIPGLALHQALRKRYIEQAVRTAVGSGFDQVVILGGGLDTLALRLHADLPHVHFIELDHPATQRVKRRVAAEWALAGGNLAFHAVDLTREPLARALERCALHDAGRRTLVVCEGVLMYLRPHNVDALFPALHALSAPAVRCVFTFMEPDAAGRAAFRDSTPLVRLWLHLRKEPFEWALARTEMARFLEDRGFALAALATETELIAAAPAAALRGRTVAAGELICVADRVRPGRER